MNHGAGVILVRKDGAVLMQHRDNKPGIFYPDYWCYPAGNVEPEEEFESAAKRELTEETGYIPQEIFPLVEEVYVRTDGQDVTRHIFWTIYDGKQEIHCNEGQEMKFVTKDEFAGKKLIPGQEKLFYLAIEKAKSI